MHDSAVRRSPFAVRRSPFAGLLLLGLSLGAAHAEKDAAKVAEANLPQVQADEIRARIEALHARQADYHKKVASGEIKPGEDLREKWPQIQGKVVSLLGMIDSLKALSADSPARPAAEEKLFGALQDVGSHLPAASHPEFTPRTLDAAQLAEMDSIGKDIAGMKFGERSKATPVKLLTPDPCFTLIHLPVPILLQCRPNDIVYLAATTGGAFHNGLSLVALQSDENGMAKTTWVSIGDAVADCDITIHSQAAIETSTMRIKVVSPSLPTPEGLPTPEQLKGEIPRLKSKLTIIKGAASQITE